MYFAVLGTMNIVTNVIVADSKEIAEEITQLICIEVPEARVDIGSRWNGTTFEQFIPAPADGPSKPLEI